MDFSRFWVYSGCQKNVALFKRFFLQPYNRLCRNSVFRNVIIKDEIIIAKFVERLKDDQIILADGHHRYAGSLAYMKQQMANNPTHTGNEGYNFHLMWPKPTPKRMTSEYCPPIA